MESRIRQHEGRPGPRGQALVVMVGVMFLSLAILAVIIDGGNVVSQQRIAQTGSDSTAEAGAVVLATRLAGAPTPAGGWDAEVATKLAASADANHITIQAAYYTDICGVPLRADGTAALNGDNTENLAQALRVGTGSLPTSTSAAPDCPSRAVGPVAGVLVLGHKDVDAFVARAIGIPTFDVDTRATAVAGFLQGYCGANEGESCAVLPVTIPVDTVFCDGQNDVAYATPRPDGTTAWLWNTVMTVPLCKSNPGNVGWLDWYPPYGGSNDVTCSIVNPDNPDITLPSWQYVAQSGNSNGGGNCTDDETGIRYSGIEDALRKYNGQVVLIPQFDQTCRAKNGDPDPISAKPTIEDPSLNYGCPNPVGGGNGQNIWYRMPSFAYFELCDPSVSTCNGRQGAYIQGNNSGICDTGNGATSCLVGKFVDILSSGTVGPGSGGGTGSKALGVQLIR